MQIPVRKVLPRQEDIVVGLNPGASKIFSNAIAVEECLYDLSCAYMLPMFPEFN